MKKSEKPKVKITLPKDSDCYSIFSSALDFSEKVESITPINVEELNNYEKAIYEKAVEIHIPSRFAVEYETSTHWADELSKSEVKQYKIDLDQIHEKISERLLSKAKGNPRLEENDPKPLLSERRFLSDFFHQKNSTKTSSTISNAGIVSDNESKTMRYDEDTVCEGRCVDLWDVEE